MLFLMSVTMFLEENSLTAVRFCSLISSASERLLLMSIYDVNMKLNVINKRRYLIHLNKLFYPFIDSINIFTFSYVKCYFDLSKTLVHIFPTYF